MKRNLIVMAVVIAAIALMLIAGRDMARRSAQSVRGPGLVGGNIAGKLAPDFELTALDGKSVKLSDFKGKAVVVNFWATWCGPCKVEIPWLVDLQKQYGPKGLVILGVAMDDAGKDKIADFAKEMGVNYTMLLGKESVAEEYGGVEALPTTFYIGRDGKVVDRIFGLVSHSEIEGDIQKALAQGSDVAASGAAK